MTVTDAKRQCIIEAISIQDAKELAGSVLLLVLNVVDFAVYPLSALLVYRLDQIAEADRVKGPGHHFTSDGLDIYYRVCRETASPAYFRDRLTDGRHLRRGCVRVLEIPLNR